MFFQSILGEIEEKNADSGKKDSDRTHVDNYLVLYNLPKSKADDLLSSHCKFQLENITRIFQNPRDSNIQCRWNDPYLSSYFF